MHFGRDFFLWWRIITEIVKILTRFLGDDSDQEELKKNDL